MARIDTLNERDFMVAVPNVALAPGEEELDEERNENGGSARETGEEGRSARETGEEGVDDENNRVTTHSSSSEGENVGGSLNDLVAGFDEQITLCFKDMHSATEEIAPVPIRDVDDLMTDSQVWYTLTGNFGNMLPLDFNTSLTRAYQMPGLNLSNSGDSGGVMSGRESEEDDELARAMDMHVMIGQSPHSAHQTAEQVIEEIDEIMQGSAVTDYTMESVDSLYSSAILPGMSTSSRDAELDAKLSEAKALTANKANETDLDALSYVKLSALHAELESLIQVYNEALVQELALKDELEFEKELNNTFISLLLQVQNKRRAYLVDKKANKVNPRAADPQYVTAAIPYQTGVPNHVTLQALIKILTAVAEDSPHVPSMLTDFILNVLCPSADGLL